MHIRRFTCLLLGVWLGGSVFMSFVATQNFRSVDQTLEKPAPRAQEMIGRLGGPETARLFLRYQAGEQNRRFFEIWEVSQLVLGVSVLFLLLFGTNEGKLPLAVALAMVLLVTVQRLFVTPPIIGLGRELDFISPLAVNPLRQQFQTWHTTYAVLELLKIGLGLLLSGLLLRPRTQKRKQAEASGGVAASMSSVET